MCLVCVCGADNNAWISSPDRVHRLIVIHHSEATHDTSVIRIYGGAKMARGDEEGGKGSQG